MQTIWSVDKKQRKPSGELPREVQRVVAKSGKAYYYLKTADGSRVRIKAEPGTAEWDRILAQAAKRVRRLPILGEPDLSPRFESLIIDYMRAPEWDAVAPATKRLKRQAFDILLHEFKAFRVESFNDERLVRELYQLRDSMRKTPSWADMVILQLSILLNWAKKRRMGITVNHALEVDRLASGRRKRRNITWSDEQRAQFIAEATPSAALALELLYWTGMRVGDLAALTWKQYDGEWLVYVPEKTRRKCPDLEVHLPIYLLPPLKKLLDDLPRKGERVERVLLTAKGLPWNASYLSRALRTERERIFGTAIDLHSHDLRGTLATRLSEAGCSDREIASITGHMDPQGENVATLGSYVARSRRLATNAYQKLAVDLDRKSAEVVPLRRRRGA